MNDRDLEIEDEILNGNVKTDPSDVKDLLEEIPDDDNEDEIDDDESEEFDENDDDIDITVFDDKLRKSKQEEINNNNRLRSKIENIDSENNRLKEEMASREAENFLMRKAMYDAELSKMKNIYAQTEADIKTLRAILKDPSVSGNPSEAKKYEDQLDSLVDSKFDLKIKYKDFVERTPLEYNNAPSEKQAVSKTETVANNNFDLDKLDVESRNFVKNNSYMNPKSSDFDQKLTDETIEYMDHLKSAYIKKGKKNKLWTSSFYAEVEKHMDEKYDSPGEKSRRLINSPITGVKRSGNYMDKDLSLMNNLARKAIKAIKIRDKNGNPVSLEHKAQIFKLKNKQHQKNKAIERGQYSGY